MKTFKMVIMLLCVASGVVAQEQDTCVHLNEITVTGLTGSTRLNLMPAPVSVVSAEVMNTHIYTNIIDAVARQPGVSQVTTGNGISKPVIRGLGYNRVLVVNDGVRQEGQQWGDEHGVEADAHGVGSVEILKGPASLMYGSDALAGVLILHGAPLPAPGEMKADAVAEYQTNSGLTDYSVDFGGNRGGVVWDLRYSWRAAHDYANRYDGYVAGSRFRERAVAGVLGLNRTWGYSRLKLSYYHLTPGMVEGVRDTVTGELERTDNGKSYTMTLPYQQVRHYKAVLDNSLLIGGGTLKVVAAYQQNRRQEYEDDDGECGLDFLLHTVNYDVRYVAPVRCGWKTSVGVGGMYQRSLNEGNEYLIPAYGLFDAGAFATVSKDLSHRIHLSGGLRYDMRRLHSHPLTDDGELRFRGFSRTFGGLTGSIGAVASVSDRLDIRLNVARGFRAPNLSELGSNGEHEGTLRYEVGDNGLKPEFSWQADIGADYSSEHFSFGLALFANRISGYIFACRENGETVGGVPVYRYTSGTARLMGGEARLIVHPLRHLHFENSFAYVSGVLADRPAGQRYLPQMPAPRWLSTLHYDIKGRSKTVSGMYVEVEMDCNMRQDRVYEAGGTETPTPAYTLVNASAGTDIMLHGRRLLTVSLMAGNIFDRAYQSHLSRLKYADVNVVTGRTGVYNMGRNFGLRVEMPIAL